MNASLLLRFGLSAVVGAAVAGTTALVTSPPAIVSTAGTGAPVDLVDAEGSPVTFALQPGSSTPVGPLPATATIQLSSFHVAGPSGAPGGPVGAVGAGWLNGSTPRVPDISQFDGGPLQSVNCVMASGAMLARLGFGIVTTGSQLRALQDDQDGATNFENLETAVNRGWGVRFFDGSLSALQLRALLYAGAGAVVVGLYGDLPNDLRQEQGFTGSHAVYIDAFRPQGPAGPAAYWVMDPLGPSWQGYKGQWWPADVLEHFATDFGGGSIYSAWAFPGGSVPANHPILPPSDYPSSAPGSTPPPGSSPSPAGSPTLDPMPPGDTPIGPDPPAGDPPPTVPHFPPISIATDVSLIAPETLDCATEPRPSGCPGGVVGVVNVGGALGGTGPSTSGLLQILYANAVAPNTFQVVFQSPPGGDPSLLLWGTDGRLLQTTGDSGTLNGQSVGIVTLTLDASSTYSFVASSIGSGVRDVSSVGTLNVGG